MPLSSIFILSKSDKVKNWFLQGRKWTAFQWIISLAPWINAPQPETIRRRPRDSSLPQCFYLVRYLLFCPNVFASFVRTLPFVTRAIPRHCLPEKELFRKNVATPELIDGVFLRRERGSAKAGGDRPLKIPESVAPYFWLTANPPPSDPSARIFVANVGGSLDNLLPFCNKRVYYIKMEEPTLPRKSRIFPLSTSFNIILFSASFREI